MKINKLLLLLLPLLLILSSAVLPVSAAVDLRGVMDAHAYKNDAISADAILPYRIYLPDAIAAGFPAGADNAVIGEITDAPATPDDPADTEEPAQTPSIEIPRDKEYGLLIWLHDEDCRGNDNTAQISDEPKNGLMNALLSDPAYSGDYIVIAPQCPRDTTWVDNDRLYLRLLCDLINTHIRTLPIDEDRILIGGISMGATAGYALITMQGSKTSLPISAAYLVAGTTDYKVEKEADAQVFASTKVYAFLSENDTVTPPDSVRALADKINAYDFTEDFTYAVYPEVGHEAWHQAFAEQALLSSFLSTNIPVQTPAETDPIPEETEPPVTDEKPDTAPAESDTQTDNTQKTPSIGGIEITSSMIAYVIMAAACILAATLMIAGLIKNNRVR